MSSGSIKQRVAAVKGVELISASDIAALTLNKGECRSVVLVHDESSTSECEIKLNRGAQLQLTEIFLAEEYRRVKISQSEGSVAEVTLLISGSANADLNISLDEPHAESRVNALFLAGEGELAEVNLRTEHNSSDCNSTSVVKGVASGDKAKGIFRGMVYVAPDAQRTDARQTSRNIELTTGAKIITEPQLEIYADDVKCSHGATVGQLDNDAILYMRQRGIEERVARRMQIEGFAEDILYHHPNEELVEIMCGIAAEKLHRM